MYKTDIDYPERRKLKVVERQPRYPTTIRPPKMTKRLDLMRGPEEFHTFLLNKQYGIQVCAPKLFWYIFIYKFSRRHLEEVE